MIEKKSYHKHAKQSGLLSEVSNDKTEKSVLTGAEKLINKEM